MDYIIFQGNTKRGRAYAHCRGRATDSPATRLTQPPSSSCSTRARSKRSSPATRPIAGTRWTSSCSTWNSHWLTSTSRNSVKTSPAETARCSNQGSGLVVDGTFSKEEYENAKQRLVLEKLDLDQRSDTVAPKLLEPLEEALSWLGSAKNVFTSGTEDQKADVARHVLLELKIDEKKVLVQAKKPLAALRGRLKSPLLWACLESNQGPQHYQCCALTI